VNEAFLLLAFASQNSQNVLKFFLERRCTRRADRLFNEF